MQLFPKEQVEIGMRRGHFIYMLQIHAERNLF